MALAKNPAPGIFLLAIGTFYLIYFGPALRFVARLAAKKAVKREPSRWIEFSDEGVRRGTALRDDLTRWVDLSEVVDWDGYYLLRLNKSKLYAWVPKRTFSSRDDEREFRELARRHVKVRALHGANA